MKSMCFPNSSFFKWSSGEVGWLVSPENQHLWRYLFSSLFKPHQAEGKLAFFNTKFFKSTHRSVLFGLTSAEPELWRPERTADPPAIAEIHGFILHICNCLCEMTWGRGTRLSWPKRFLFFFYILCVRKSQTVSLLLRRTSCIFFKQRKVKKNVLKKYPLCW